eukprot:c37116_g1_i1.p1 GENE.c37116_g1_i1~~c37116_g1_i1.p1  ORF type:complete len:201 (+),score=51.31 c37116_g1_i1:521-1123(+)
MTQQMIKLAVVDQIKTTFYLILDADVICFKPTSFHDLIINGKAIINIYDSSNIVTRDEWWKASMKILKTDLDLPMFTGVTPTIFSTEIVSKLKNKIQQINKEDWISYLLKNVYIHPFTEYTLYGVFAISTKMFENFHIPSQSGLYNHEKSVFWKNQFDSVDLYKIMEFSSYFPGYFLVFQSNTGISALKVREKMGTLFEN